jgi:DHA1 family tetracycline resistance protein-like MFS transporter
LFGSFFFFPVILLQVTWFTRFLTAESMADTTTNEQPADNKFFTRPLLIIFLTIFIDLVGFGIVIPLLTFYAEEFRATPFDVGLLVSSYSLMQFVFSPFWGSLSDRYGRRPILFLTILGSSVGYLILGSASALWMVYAGRILAGIMGGNLSTAQAYIADVTSKENRAKGMGLFGMAFGLGFILGPAMAGILSRFGMRVPFLFAAGLSLVNAILLYFILPEPRKHEEPAAERKGRIAELAGALRRPRFAIITLEYFLLVTAFSIMTTSFAYYTMVKFGYDAERTGYLLTYVGFLAAIVQGAVFGKLSERFGEAPLATAGSIAMVVSLVIVPFVGKDFGGLAGLLLGTAGFAVGNSIASPALTSLASKITDDREQGRSLGILQSAASLARVFGPLLCGLLLNNAFNQVDDSTLLRTYWVAAAIMLAAFFTSIYYSRIMTRQGDGEAA